ncbi:MAG: hypothetical protein ACTHN7_03375 [Solirubrobacterales bacterium]
MKYLKMLGLAAVAAAALMAFAGAGSASATVLCHRAETPCLQKWPKGTEIEFTVRPGTKARWASEPTTVMECSSGDLKGSVASAGGSSETVKIPLSTFEWSGSCAPAISSTLETGELEIHSISGSENGRVTLKGFTDRMENTPYGTCVYTSGSTGIGLGTLTASKTGEAIIDIETTLTRKEGSSAFCPLTVTWWEQWIQTAPSGTPLFVEPS